MGLLSFDNTKLIINPETLAILPFKTIWQRDKSKNKEVAIAELSYVFYVEDFKSIYRNIPEEERGSKIKEDLFPDNKWKADATIKAACKKYAELHITQSMGLLLDAEGAIEKLRKYFREVNLTDTNDQGKLLFTAKDLIANIKAVGDLISGMKKLKEEVAKEVDNNSTIKGGSAIGPFEDPDDEDDEDKDINE